MSIASVPTSFIIKVRHSLAGLGGTVNMITDAEMTYVAFHYEAGADAEAVAVGIKALRKVGE